MTSSDDTPGLAALLEAFADRSPGPPRHPGPRSTSWLGARAAPPPPADGRPRRPGHVPVTTVLRRAWWSGSHHVDARTGRPTTVRQRPTPSAGGAYPVQLHAVVGRGCDLPRGRYALDADSGRMTTLGTATSFEGAVVVLSVLPQRSTARYHHRAWPLWVADVVYAVHGVLLAAASTGTAATWWRGPGPDELARLAGLPTADGWERRWPGSGAETCLAAVHLATGATPPTPADVRSDLDVTARAWDERAHLLGPRPSELPAVSARQVHVSAPDHRPVPEQVTPDQLRRRLAARRSPAPGHRSGAGGRGVVGERLLRRLDEEVPTPPAGTVVRVRAPGGRRPADDERAWVDRCDTLVTVEHRVSTGPSGARDLLAATWWAAVVGARLTFGGARARPVAGWVRPAVADDDRAGSAPGTLTLHGVALWHAEPGGITGPADPPGHGVPGPSPATAAGRP